MNICPYCAESIHDDAQFCQFCGTSLGTTVAVPPSPGLPSGEAHTSGKAIASLICGIFFFVLPSAIVAIILGHLSYSEIGKSLGRIRGRGVALAGLILGYSGVAFIPFILIIAAITIPNLLRAKMAANEASVVGSLRSYQYAMGVYASKCPRVGFPKSLANLGPGRGDCERADLLDRSLGAEQPVKFGYYFHYVVAEPDDIGQVTSFVITADPVDEGKTGSRHFYIDQTGIIHWTSNQPADAGSPVLQ